MATLTAKLSLTSQNATSSTLNLNVSDVMTVGNPITGLSKVTATETGNETIILSSHSSIRYLFLKHTGLDSSDAKTTSNLEVEIENGKSFAELGPGEFLWVPVGQNSGSVLVQLEAVSGTVVAEYAYFTKS